MKKLSAFLCLLSSVLCPPFASAQVPQIINYQGRLLNGTNLVNGNIGLSLRLFDAAVAGTLLYEDSNTVTVADGLYSTFIGDNTIGGNLQAALNNSNVWIEAAVDGDALSPRERVASVAYAQLANGVGIGAITTAMLVDGAVTSNKLASSAVTTAALAEGAVTGGKIATNTVTTSNVQEGSLRAADMEQLFEVSAPMVITNPVPANFERFANSVTALGTNRFIIGDAEESIPGFNGVGVVRIYDLAGTILSTITNPSPGFSADYFGHVVTAVSTSRFVVTTPYDDESSPDSGRAYLYTSTGTLVTVLTNPAPSSSDYFGWSAAGLGFGAIVVGAPYDDAAATNSGLVHVFQTDGSFVRSVTNPLPANESYFGSAVAGVGNSQFLASSLPSGGAGMAFLFNFSGILQATITNPAPTLGTEFGRVVAKVGSNLFAISDRSYTDRGLTGSGRVYLYDTNGTLQLTLNNPYPQQLAYFGSSITALGTNWLAVGASYAYVGSAGSAGIVNIFDLSGRHLATLASPSPQFGAKFGDTLAAIGTNWLVVGAPDTAVNSITLAGSAFLFSTAFNSSFVPGLTAESVAPGAIGIAELDVASVDARYVQKSGDTMTGKLNLPDGGLAVGSSNFVVATNFVGVGRTNVITANEVFGIRAPQTNGYGGMYVQTAGAAAKPFYGYAAGGGAAAFHYIDGNDTNKWKLNVGSFDRITVNANNGFVGIGTTAPTATLHVVGNIYATGTITPSSDRNVKKNIEPVDVQAILEKLSAMPLQTWTYKAEDDGIRHLGPMAQDFQAAFGLGANNISIATVDADGVALAAIQALKKENDAKTAEIETLKKQNEEILQRLRALEAK